MAGPLFITEVLSLVYISEPKLILFMLGWSILEIILSSFYLKENVPSSLSEAEKNPKKHFKTKSYESN